MSSATLLNQDDLKRWRHCPRHFWLHRHGHAARMAPHTRLADEALAQHSWPDQALRASFPESVVIDEPHTDDDWDRAISQTQHLLNDGYLIGMHTDGEGEGRAIFGACLASNDGARVRIDVLTTGSHGLRLFRVRYATIGDDADVDTAALWTHVAARCGLRVQSAGLLLIDTDFTYPGHGCYAGLFREADLSPVLGSRTIPNWLVAMRTCERTEQPEVQPDARCAAHGGCDFTAHCGAPEPASKATHHASLDIVGRELAQALRSEGHTDLMTVPEQRMPDARRRRALRAVQSGLPELDADIAQAMNLPYPRHTLRFDTIGFATPIWPGTRPYQVLPFQWTCDTEVAPGQLLRQRFLADKEGDPRRAFAESLLQAVGHEGPVIAYNAGFERNRMRELALLFEDLATDLEVLMTRVVDLFQIARAHYYHPAQCGSWSFKAMCRAIAPDLRADQFEWAGETAAQVAFARSQQERLDDATAQTLRAALIDHGHRQTEALRRLVACFEHTTRP